MDKIFLVKAIFENTWRWKRKKGGDDEYQQVEDNNEYEVKEEEEYSEDDSIDSTDLWGSTKYSTLLENNLERRRILI